MKIDNSNITVSAKRESGGMVPYGSTYVSLPDEVEVNWKGNIRIDFNDSDIMDVEDPVTGIDYDAALRDAILEALKDAPESFEYGGSRRFGPEEGKIYFTDFTILMSGTNLVVEEGGYAKFVVIEPIDYEWV